MDDPNLQETEMNDIAKPEDVESSTWKILAKEYQGIKKGEISLWTLI